MLISRCSGHLAVVRSLNCQAWLWTGNLHPVGFSNALKVQNKASMCRVTPQKSFLRCSANRKTKDHEESNGVRWGHLLQEIRKIWMAWWSKESSIKNRKWRCSGHIAAVTQKTKHRRTFMWILWNWQQNCIKQSQLTEQWCIEQSYSPVSIPKPINAKTLNQFRKQVSNPVR